MRRWTQEEITRLIELWNARVRIDDIGEELFRTHQSISAKARYLKLKGRKLGAKRTHPVYQMKVGDSIFIPNATENRRRKYHVAAARAAFTIITRTRIVNGERGCRITRIAA